MAPRNPTFYTSPKVDGIIINRTQITADEARISKLIFARTAIAAELINLRLAGRRNKKKLPGKNLALHDEKTVNLQVIFGFITRATVFDHLGPR